MRFLATVLFLTVMTAGAAMALVVTGDPLQAARIGNLVAGITIMKKGTGTASPEEVISGPGPEGTP